MSTGTPSLGLNRDSTGLQVLWLQALQMTDEEKHAWAREFIRRMKGDVERAARRDTETQLTLEPARG